MADYRYQSVEPASYSSINNNNGNDGGYNSGYGSYFNQQAQKNKRSKWIAIGSVVGIIVLVAIGVGVGVGVAKSRSGSPKSAATNSNSNGASSSSGVVPQTDPNDPSTFVKNPALKKSFYAMAYTPYGSQLPTCNNSLADVITDIQLLSQLTTRIRLYGADCNQSALVLEAIKQTKVDMSVYLGIYPIPSDAGAAYVRQRDIIKSALQTYGTDHVLGLTVGNEFILNYLGDNGGTTQDPNGAVGNAGADLLLTNISDARSMVSGLGLKIPVGNADAGSYFNNKILAAVDYGMANVHPWFASQAVQDAAAWTFDFFATTNVAPANALPNKPPMYIAETGWPTKSSSKEAESDGKSLASVDNLQIFLDTFVCQANKNNVGYFFFEYFDEGWKDVQFGGVEGWWGLFNADRTLKNVKIPDCASP
ncbi:Glycoside hydrolase family 17 protein [Mycena indigotica]|uniref:glucan endo-1,3-beta-D-glucosidase n=1 Tax=Mycena indigotica TaxID=2126181 RepID=A0A8H6SPC9_9AGAR|nr:Glycoside hydrolase family 17 protein [Mycena indigotica]KAF7301932.1 Glycoside hydrolase family 17 protein [Mycena indigotica]